MSSSAATRKKIYDYAIPVRRSIIHRDLWLGIPFIPLMALGFATILMVFTFGQVAFLVITVIAWFVLKQITKKDEWLLDIILTSLLQPDELR
ncbi:MAG: VirB3 family type IV secretion system protein [Treponema sp.]|nr:VirB3 family type IV secretion system protein [Treponema sp.]